MRYFHPATYFSKLLFATSLQLFLLTIGGLSQNKWFKQDAILDTLYSRSGGRFLFDLVNIKDDSLYFDRYDSETGKKEIIIIWASEIGEVVFGRNENEKSKVLLPLDSGCYSFYNGFCYSDPKGILCFDKKVWMLMKGDSAMCISRGDKAVQLKLFSIPRDSYNLLDQINLDSFFEWVKSPTAITLITSILLFGIAILLRNNSVKKRKYFNFTITDSATYYIQAIVMVGIFCIPLYLLLDEVDKNVSNILVITTADPFQKLEVQPYPSLIAIDGYSLGFRIPENAHVVVTSEDGRIDSITYDRLGIHRTIPMQDAIELTIDCKITNVTQSNKSITIENIEAAQNFNIIFDGNSHMKLVNDSTIFIQPNKRDSTVKFPVTLNQGEQFLCEIRTAWLLDRNTASFLYNLISLHPKTTLFEALKQCSNRNYEVSKSLNHKNKRSLEIEVKLAEGKKVITNFYLEFPKVNYLEKEE